MKSIRLMVAGGGTGGHINGGLAVIDAWRSTFGDQADVFFVGAKGGLEEKLVPRDGVPLFLLRIRALKGLSRVRQFWNLLLLPFAFTKAFYLLLRIRPHACLGVGGYASGPVLLLAGIIGRLWRCKTGILEQNSVPGLTNKILSHFSDHIFSAFGKLDRYFPNSDVQVSGNPVRRSFARKPPAQLDPPTIFVFGGSQGALGINSLVIEALPHLKDAGVRWIHQTGERDYDRVLQAHRKNETDHKVEQFIFGMDEAFGEASFVVCRAGASTLAELAAVGRASILIPLPTAADDHQTQNAETFAQKGAAMLFSQRTGTGEGLAELIEDWAENIDRIHGMEERVAKLHHPDAAQALVSALAPKASQDSLKPLVKAGNEEN